MEILISAYFSNIYCSPAFPPPLDYLRVDCKGNRFSDCVETAIRVISPSLFFSLNLSTSGDNQHSAVQ